MTEKINPELLAEIKTTCEAADPGPWETCGYYIRTKFDGHSGGYIIAEMSISDMNFKANAAFLSCARTAMPALAAALEKSEADKARLEKEKAWLAKKLAKDGDCVVNTIGGICPRGFMGTCYDAPVSDLELCWNEAAGKAVEVTQ